MYFARRLTCSLITPRIQWNTEDKTRLEHIGGWLKRSLRWNMTVVTHPKRSLRLRQDFLRLVQGLQVTIHLAVSSGRAVNRESLSAYFTSAGRTSAYVHVSALPSFALTSLSILRQGRLFQQHRDGSYPR